MEHIFHETGKQAKATAGNHLAEANRASHGPRVLAKETATRVMEKSEGKSKSKNAKGSCKGKTSKVGLSGFEKTEVRDKFGISGICTGLDGMKVGNKLMTLPPAHFHMEVLNLVV